MTEVQQAIIDMFKPQTQAPASAAAQTPAASVSSGIDTSMPSQEAYGKAGVAPKGIDPNIVASNPYLSALSKQQSDIYKKLAADPEFNANKYLPGGDAKNNINMRDHPQTLRLSRLADAMNNRYFRSMQHLDSTSALFGGGAVGQTADAGELYKMPVETEEQRQLARMRQYEADVRGKEIARQQGGKDIALEQARKEYEERLRLSGKYSDEQVRQLMEAWDFQMGYYKEARTAAFQRQQASFQAVLTGLKLPIAQSSYIMSLVRTDPSRANMYAALFGIGAGAPTPEQDLWNRTVGGIITRGKSSGKTDQQILNDVISEGAKTGMQQVVSAAGSLAGQMDDIGRVFSEGATH